MNHQVPSESAEAHETTSFSRAQMLSHYEAREPQIYGAASEPPCPAQWALIPCREPYTMVRIWIWPGRRPDAWYKSLTRSGPQTTWSCLGVDVWFRFVRSFRQLGFVIVGSAACTCANVTAWWSMASRAVGRWRWLMLQRVKKITLMPSSYQRTG